MRSGAFRLLALVAVVGLAGVSRQVAAQQRFEFGLGGGYYTLSGDDFEGTDAGMGLDAVGRIVWPSGLGVGLSLQRNTHSADFVDDDITVLGILGDVRYAFSPQGTNVRPYVGGRFGWVKESAEVLGDDAEASGWMFGAVGGVMFALSTAVTFDASVGLYQVSFGDGEIDGETIPDSDTSGSSLGLRLGLIFRLPGGGS